MKLMKVTAVTSAIALALIGSGAAAANASNSVTYGNAIVAAYNSSLNKLSVYDAKQDGYGGRSLYELSNGATGNLDNDLGFGQTTVKSISGSGWIRFKACKKDGPTTIGCSAQVSSGL